MTKKVLTQYRAHASNPDMQTVADILKSIGSNAEVARRLGVGTSVISECKRRNSLPVKYWPGIILLAAEAGVIGVNSDTLVMIHAKKTDAENGND